jgi:hypothetical protein
MKDKPIGINNDSTGATFQRKVAHHWKRLFDETKMLEIFPFVGDSDYFCCSFGTFVFHIEFRGGFEPCFKKKVFLRQTVNRNLRAE